MKRSSSKPKTRPQAKAAVDRHLRSLPPKARMGLEKVRRAIKAVAPGAEEGFSYGLPAFKLGGRSLVCYDAFKEHSSFFPMSGRIVQKLAAELKRYSTSRGTVRFPHHKPPPATLIKKLVRARIAEIEKKY
ncbi:MAG TPA: DUF1801 domain-containing protein [Gemmatimonadales bacterium]|nr:DUF1801 domain-containing protein [Gemmatimonadales bacterium]